MAQVHVLDAENNAFFEGVVVDVQSNRCAIVFHDSNSADWIENKLVYNAPSELTLRELRQRFNPQVDDEVEVYSTEERAWWRGKIKSIKNECFLVVFPNPEYNDLYEPQNIFPVVQRTKFQYQTRTFPIAAALRQSVIDTQEDLPALAQVAGLTGIWLDDGKQKLVGVGSPAALESAGRAVEMYLRRVGEIAKLKKMKSEMLSVLEKGRDDSGFTAHFTVEPDLIGFVIGKKGKNVNKAQELPGVRRVDVKENGTVTVWADTEEAAMKARELLHYVRAQFDMHRDELPAIVGRNGDNIRYIQETSGVMRLELRDDDCQIEVIGTPRTVETARQLLFLQHHYFEKQKEIQSEISQLVRDLREIGVRTPGNYPGGEMRRFGGNRDSNPSGPAGRGRGRGRPGAANGFNNGSNNAPGARANYNPSASAEAAAASTNQNRRRQQGQRQGESREPQQQQQGGQQQGQQQGQRQGGQRQQQQGQGQGQGQQPQQQQQQQQGQRQGGQRQGGQRQQQGEQHQAAAAAGNNNNNQNQGRRQGEKKDNTNVTANAAAAADDGEALPQRPRKQGGNKPAQDSDRNNNNSNGEPRVVNNKIGRPGSAKVKLANENNTNSTAAAAAAASSE